MIVALLMLLAAAGAAPVGGESVVTLPLQQLLPLLEKKPAAKPKPPPMSAVITAAQFKGRLAADALIVEARFEVAVLADGDWVRVPLLPLAPGVAVVSPARADQGTVAVVDGVLTLITNKASRCAIDVGLSVPARHSGPRREISLGLPGA